MANSPWKRVALRRLGGLTAPDEPVLPLLAEHVG